ncbi:MAG: hypothetical protein U0175_07840 [Caldilineaceae bacterium]
MLNDYQIAILTADRLTTYRGEAEQWLLVKQATAGQPNPIRVWLGRQLTAWGQRMAQHQSTVALPLTTAVATRLTR